MSFPVSLSPNGLSSHWRTFLEYSTGDGKSGGILMLSFSLHLLPGIILFKKKKNTQKSRKGLEEVRAHPCSQQRYSQPPGGTQPTCPVMDEG